MHQCTCIHHCLLYWDPLRLSDGQNQRKREAASGRKVLVGWLANNNKEARKNRTSQTQRGREKKKRESSGAPRGTDGGLLVVPWAPNPRAGNLAVFSPRHLSTRRGASDGLVAPPFVWGSLAMGSLHPSSFRLRPASVFSLSLIDLMLRVFHAANSLGY